MRTRIIIPLILFFTVVVSCRQAPDNGLLDGQWQVTSIETVDSTYAPERMYYSFQKRIFQLRQVHRPAWEALGYFYHEGDSLKFDFKTGIPLDIALHYGMSDTICGFRVEQLTQKNMTLSEGQKRIRFRKF